MSLYRLRRKKRKKKINIFKQRETFPSRYKIKKPYIYIYIYKIKSYIYIYTHTHTHTYIHTHTHTHNSFPGEENGNPLRYSCLENPMDREEPGGLHSMGSQRVGHD